MAMVDCIRHAAIAYSQATNLDQDQALLRIMEGFQAELSNPTDEPRPPARERVDDAGETGRRHMVKALVGPAQRVRRDDDVIHRKQRIVRLDGLGFEHVERRAGDPMPP